MRVARHHKLTELKAEHGAAVDQLKRENSEQNMALVRAIEDELKSLSGTEAGPPDAF